MNIYEALYVAHPNLEDDNLTNLVTATKASLLKRGGELLYEEIIGKKRLAYPIEKQRYGTYVLLQFQGESVDIVNLEQDFEINDNVLAKIIVAIDADEVRTVTQVEEAAEETKAPAENKPAEAEAKDAKPAEESVEDDAPAEPEAVELPEAENIEEVEEATEEVASEEAVVEEAETENNDA